MAAENDRRRQRESSDVRVRRLLDAVLAFAVGKDGLPGATIVPKKDAERAYRKVLLKATRVPVAPPIPPESKIKKASTESRMTARGEVDPLEREARSILPKTHWPATRVAKNGGQNPSAVTHGDNGITYAWVEGTQPCVCCGKFPGSLHAKDCTSSVAV